MHYDPAGRPSATEAEFPLTLEQVLEGLEDGVLKLAEGCVVGVNSALVRMLGRPRRELLGRRLGEFLCDGDGSALARPVAGHTLRLRDPRGGLVPVALRELAPGVYLVVDRSREMKLEEEVWRLSHQVRRRSSGAAPPTPLDGEAPAMIEHEIRTACTAIRGYLRMLLGGAAGELGAAAREYLQETLRASERIGRLLDDLLELSRPDGPEAQRIVCKPAHLHGVVGAAVAATRPLLERNGITLALELEAEHDGVRADAQRLEQVVVNLLANAVKFGPPGGSVRVATHEVELETGPWLCLSVADEGPGVQSEEAERIFEPFARGRLGGSGRTGVGLGLAICRKVVEAHGGSIHAVPAQGFGLFRVLLPVQR
ncbi:MAG: ATP-binding protein [Myxococcota bacterium]